MSSASNETGPGLPKSEGPFEEPHDGHDGPWPSPHSDEEGPEAEPEAEPTPDTDGTRPAPENQRHYPPRMCRICLETMLPTCEATQGGFSGMVNPRPRVSYVSADPEAGRLFRPCKCKGSSRYVHEGCLQAWRHADKGYSRRNFYECPTCGFRYQLERMRYARWITSPFTQILLTIVIMFVIVFLCGFITDPVISLLLGDIEPLEDIQEDFQEAYDAPWTLHFIKGLLSLGVMSFMRVAALPTFFWNLRLSPRLDGRRGGRERAQDMTLIMVLVGLVTVMVGVWKWVRKWSRRGLERAGQRLADVQGEDDDFEEGPAAPPASEQATSPEGETRKMQ